MFPSGKDELAPWQKAAKKLMFLERLPMSPSPWQATRLTNQDSAPPECSLNEFPTSFWNYSWWVKSG